MTAPTDLEIQAAVVARLRSYAGLTALVGQAVFDQPPADQPLPLVYIPNVEFRPINADGCAGGDWVISLRVISDYAGKAEVHRINGQIVVALDGFPLPVNGWVMTRQIFKDAAADDQGVTEAGDVRFNIMAMTIGD